MKADRRREPRIQANAPALVQTLGRSAKTNGRPHLARIVDMSSKGIRLHTETPLIAGSVVQVEVDDTMVLGEVCYCVPGSSSAFNVGVLAKQSLVGLSALAQVKRINQK